MPEQTEAQFEAAVVELAKLNGWMVYHARISKGSVAGWPDLTLVRGGTLIFAELKTEKGLLSRAQRSWFGALRDVVIHAHRQHAYGVVAAYLWRPSDWPEIERTLR